MRFVLLACALLMSSFPIVTRADDLVSRKVQDIDGEILAHRRAISSVRMHITCKRANGETSTFEYLQDEGHVREDRVGTGNMSIKSLGREFYYAYAAPGKVPDRHYALKAVSLKQFDRHRVEFINPLKLMLMPGYLQTLTKIPFENYVNSPNRSAFEIEDAEWEGVPAKRIECQLNHLHPGKLTYWVLPSRSYNIVKMQVRWSGSDKSDHLDDLECSLQQPAVDVWFPKEIKFRRTTNGTPSGSQDITVQILSINKSLDLDFFEPKTMNLVEGTFVSRLPIDPRGQSIWNGSQIVIATRDQVLANLFRAPTAASSARRVYWILASTSAVLALIALYWRRRMTRNN